MREINFTNFGEDITFQNKHKSNESSKSVKSKNNLRDTQVSKVGFYFTTTVNLIISNIPTILRNLLVSNRAKNFL